MREAQQEILSSGESTKWKFQNDTSRLACHLIKYFNYFLWFHFENFQFQTQRL